MADKRRSEETLLTGAGLSADGSEEIITFSKTPDGGLTWADFAIGLDEFYVWMEALVNVSIATFVVGVYQPLLVWDSTPTNGSSNPVTSDGIYDFIIANVLGLWDDRGNFDASVNAYPSSGGSGTAGAILKGDIWTVSVGGTLPTGQVVTPGDTVRALVDTPGNTEANWAIAQNNLTYVPEDEANKVGVIAASATDYPNNDAVIAYVNGRGFITYRTITNAAMTTAKGAGTLVPGDWYMITDLGTVGELQQAVTTKQVSPFALRSFLLPDYQGIGDYSGVAGFNTAQGIWNADGEGLGFADGDVVVWNNRHYQVIDDGAFAGTNPSVNVTAYSLLTQNVANGHVIEWDEIYYDTLIAEVLWRKDRRGNIVYVDGSSATVLGAFQWGRDLVMGNIVHHGGILSCVNAVSEIKGNTVKSGTITINDASIGSILNNTFAIGQSTPGTNNEWIVNKDGGKYLMYCNIAFVANNITLNPTIDEIGLVCNSSASTFAGLLVITGLTTMNINTVRHCGIINLSSTNATENINLISNGEGMFPREFRPETGLTVTFTGTAAASITNTGEILLPMATVVLAGTTYDWVELTPMTIGVDYIYKQTNGANYI